MIRGQWLPSGEDFMQDTGRPRKEVDWDKVEKMCAIACTGEEIAQILSISYDTLMRRVKEKFGISFADYYNQKSAMGKMSLRRKQFDLAVNKGDRVMLIWLGKQRLGQADQVQSTVTNIEVKHNYKDPRSKDEN